MYKAILFAVTIGKCFFACSFGCVRDKSFHFLRAVHYWDACIMDKPYQIATAVTPLEGEN